MRLRPKLEINMVLFESLLNVDIAKTKHQSFVNMAGHYLNSPRTMKSVSHP